jgi:phage terminase small subunit
MEERGTLSRADTFVLEMLAREFVAYRVATESEAKMGPATEGAVGNPKQSPESLAANQKLKNALALLRECGLTPAARMVVAPIGREGQAPRLAGTAGYAPWIAKLAGGG